MTGGMFDGLGRVLGCCLGILLLFVFLLGAATASCVRACPVRVEVVR